MPAAAAASWCTCTSPCCGGGWFKKCAPNASRSTSVVARIRVPPTASSPSRNAASAACTPRRPRPAARWALRMPLLGSKISPELFTRMITSNSRGAPSSSIAESSEIIALQPGVSSTRRRMHAAAAGIESCLKAAALVKTSAVRAPALARPASASAHLSIETVVEIASICGTYVVKWGVAKCAARWASDSHSSTITKRVGESALLTNAYLMQPASRHVWCASTSAIASHRSCTSIGTSLVTTTWTVCAGLGSATAARAGAAAAGTPAALAAASSASLAASSALVVRSGWSDRRPSTKKATHSARRRPRRSHAALSCSLRGFFATTAP
mmetsp:Transcript_8547/g.26925  ORF Transcript_8547/g.26925 Transcript_8547/m.26925 type:complete len:327 (+) Transcript_8547:597-1577(+)